MSRVLQTRRARRDLDDIWFYIARDNPERADQFVDSIVVKCESISESPYMGRARPELGSGVRSLPHEEYIIYYRVSGDGIDVLRVIHGARDISADWIA